MDYLGGERVITVERPKAPADVAIGGRNVVQDVKQKADGVVGSVIGECRARVGD